MFFDLIVHAPSLSEFYPGVNENIVRTNILRDDIVLPGLNNFVAAPKFVWTRFCGQLIFCESIVFVINFVRNRIFE